MSGTKNKPLDRAKRKAMRWGTADGAQTTVGEMTSSHLLNALWYLEVKTGEKVGIKVKTGVRPGYEPVAKAFTEELLERGIPVEVITRSAEPFPGCFQLIAESGKQALRAMAAERAIKLANQGNEEEYGKVLRKLRTMAENIGKLEQQVEKTRAASIVPIKLFKEDPETPGRRKLIDVEFGL